MAKSLKKGNTKLIELKEKYNDIAFEMTMPMAGTFEQIEFNYTDNDLAEKMGQKYDKNQVVEQLEYPIEQVEQIDKNLEETRIVSTASRSSEKAEYNSQSLTQYVDSRKRVKRRGANSKTIFNES